MHPHDPITSSLASSGVHVSGQKRAQLFHRFPRHATYHKARRCNISGQSSLYRLTFRQILRLLIHATNTCGDDDDDGDDAMAHALQ